MSIQVKRDTGVMGGATGVDLKVNNERVKTLKNNEEYMIEPENESVKIRANQWFFGSEEKEVTKGSVVYIKTNSTGIFLLLESIMAAVLGKYISPIFPFIGLAAIIFTGIYSSKNWFMLEVEEIAQEERNNAI